MYTVHNDTYDHTYALGGDFRNNEKQHVQEEVHKKRKVTNTRDNLISM
jgi:hypothetical protein